MCCAAPPVDFDGAKRPRPNGRWVVMFRRTPETDALHAAKRRAYELSRSERLEDHPHLTRDQLEAGTALAS